MSQSLISLLTELDAAITQSDPMRHVRSLKRITNLFVTTAESLAETHIDVYDEVMRRFLLVVETETRASVARVLAPITNAARKSVNVLARDHISVAAPILAQSQRLSDNDLS